MSDIETTPTIGLDSTPDLTQSAEPSQSTPSFLDRIGEKLEYVDFEDRPAKVADDGLEDPKSLDSTEPTIENTLPIEEIDENTLDLDIKAKAKWGELRKELKEAKARLAEWQSNQPTQTSQTQTTQAPEELTDAIEHYKQQIDQYERQLAVSKIESSREYREMVIAPMDSIIEATETIAQAYGIDPEALVDAVTESNSKKQTDKLAELVDVLPERDRQRIYRMADDSLMIYEQDAKLREDALQAAKELEFRERQTQEMTKAEYKAAVKKATEKTWDVFKERLAPILQDVQVDTLVQDALKADLDSADVELKSYSASAGILLPHLVEKLSKKDIEIAELKKTLKSYQKATPKVATSEASSAPATGGGFLERVSQRLGR